jgi:TrmH family RNA methyltransferase
MSNRDGRHDDDGKSGDGALGDGQLGALRVVLVETTHPGNVGAAARAMWTMGLERLELVRPVPFRCAEATARAAGADELLYQAGERDSLEAAVDGCAWVVGTTARRRRLGAPALSPREWAGRAAAAARDAEIALVLGRESSGLTNAEIDLCQALVHIPANPHYSSLNLASAVQVLAYEYRQAVLGG